MSERAEVQRNLGESGSIMFSVPGRWYSALRLLLTLHIKLDAGNVYLLLLHHLLSYTLVRRNSLNFFMVSGWWHYPIKKERKKEISVCRKLCISWR